MNIPRKLIFSALLLCGISILGCNSESSSKPISESNDVPLPGNLSKITFPDGFIWGAATASYQVEGGRYDTSDKKLRTDTYWDLMATYGTGVNGDIAIDQYNRYQEDVSLMAKAGLKAYRFSLSIPRLFLNNDGYPVKRHFDPKTKQYVFDKDEDGNYIPAEPNQVGVDYYNNLIDELIANGVEPVITLFHWDLPLGMVMAGGFGNRDTTEQYKVYSATVFKLFGDRVKKWTTLNEPFSYNVSTQGLSKAMQAQGVDQYSIAKYIALEDVIGYQITSIHNYLLSHAKAVSVFHQLKSSGALPADSEIGMTFDLGLAKSASDSLEDVQATNTFNDFKNGIFVDPIFEGKYPDHLLETLSKRNPAYSIKISKDQMSSDLQFMKANSGDFVALNYYSRPIVAKRTVDKSNTPKSTWPWQHGLPTSGIFLDDIWVDRGVDKLGSNNGPYDPQGLYDTMIWLSKKSNNIPMLITENGTGNNAGNVSEDIISPDGKVHDPIRTQFLTGNFKAMWKAIQDGVDLRGYFVWSIFDNLEWTSFDKRFGIIYINYNDDLKRIPKDSYYFYSQVINDNGLTTD